MHFKKSIISDFIFLVIIQSIYFFPLIIIGLDRIEDYQYNHFSALILAKNSFSPFIFFYDLIGPGTRLPLGSGLNYFFPPAIFITNLKIFYFLVFIIGAYIQLNYFKKISKLFKFNNFYILSLFYAFNIEILWQVFVGDSLKTFFSVSCFPLIFYYLIKFINLQKKYYFFKLVLVVGYIILNTHEAYILTNFLGFFLLIIFNKKLFFLKEKYFYIGSFFLILILGENFYRLSYEFKQFEDVLRPNIIELSPKHYASGIVFFLKFFETFLNIDLPFLSEFKSFDNFWLPFGGVIFYFAFFQSIKLIINNNSKNVYFINYIFLTLIVLSCLNLKDISFSIISEAWLMRDINNFFSIILFGSFLSKIKNLKFKWVCISISSIFIIFHVILSINAQYKDLKDQEYNFFNTNKEYKQTVFYEKTNSIYNEELNFSKTYLSNGVWNSILSRKNKIFIEANIFHFNDLLKYSIYPFNTEFKNANKNILRRSKVKMYSVLDPRKNEINSDIFFNLFNIDYLMILDSEKKSIDISKYEIISEIQKEDEEKIILLRFKNYKSNIILNNDKKIIDNNKCKTVEIISCLLKDPYLFQASSNIQIKRLSLNKYEIKNTSELKQKIILPFLYDKSWKSKNGKIKDIKKSLMFVELEPNKNLIIYYRDSIRIVLKMLSIMSFSLLAFFIIKFKKTN
jgi:hypothetical protein